MNDKLWVASPELCKIALDAIKKLQSESESKALGAKIEYVMREQRVAKG